MLAYVFSHRPARAADTRAYEDALRRFHAALAAERPHGFISSMSYRIAGGGYSDWYLLRDSAGLDALNDAAVTGDRAQVHDAVARVAVDGVGKLMALVAGELDAHAQHEIHFAKPPGMGYGDLHDRLNDWITQPGVSLWRRMMVLGPGPEFCLLSPARVELPEEMRPEIVNRQVL